MPAQTSEPVVRRRQHRLNSLIGVVAAFLALVVVLLVTDDSNGRSASRAIEMPSIDGGASFWSTAAAPSPPAKQSKSAQPISGGFVAQPAHHAPAPGRPVHHSAPNLLAGPPGISLTGHHDSSPVTSTQAKKAAKPVIGLAASLLNGTSKHKTVPISLPKLTVPLTLPGKLPAATKKVTGAVKHVTKTVTNVASGALKKVTSALHVPHLTTSAHQLQKTVKKTIHRTIRHATSPLRRPLVGLLKRHTRAPAHHGRPTRTLVHTTSIVKPTWHHVYHPSRFHPSYHRSSHSAHQHNWSSFSEMWWARFGWHHH